MPTHIQFTSKDAPLTVTVVGPTANITSHHPVIAHVNFRAPGQALSRALVLPCPHVHASQRPVYLLVCFSFRLSCVVSCFLVHRPIPHSTHLASLLALSVVSSSRPVIQSHYLAPCPLISARFVDSSGTSSHPPISSFPLFHPHPLVFLRVLSLCLSSRSSFLTCLHTIYHPQSRHRPADDILKAQHRGRSKHLSIHRNQMPSPRRCTTSPPTNHALSLPFVASLETV